MKVAFISVILLLPTAALSIPQSDLAEGVVLVPRSHEPVYLEKRRGGGGGRGGSSGGGSGGRGGSGGSTSRAGSSSNSGGSSRSGSGPQPTYGRGTYYAGGARTPYTSGALSPLGVAPVILPAAALAFFGGIWLYGAYAYPYNYHYQYVDQITHHNASMPVVCLCEKYAECACDDNSDRSYYESIFNGTQPTNSSVAKIVKVNGTETIYINGTLPNGTTVADASTPSGAARTGIQISGYWSMVALVASTIWGL
ncbi:conserved glycine-rich protein [Aspergillus nomiae NRRL 13137]|uniref:Conserved glycine-rich protein n=1 Tax=Aspergillus nomiae NRRL (strain ATCC 15546 / NRRL 13137 / CBS 260.88 / M93) TaxID=1509407 RepID=A0A0L1JEW6_ASPN3|nr:conserved glycine-rich protein [Aspergillus nomiae NRRL 13137]KNG90281.1 conserved glycine-rich protein [Aspergillus nomiae NRRL 13137]